MVWLIIENHTKSVLGYLYNTGNGRTIFKKPLTKIKNSTYIWPETMKVYKSNAWLHGGNSFGVTVKVGTKDNRHVDFITNNTQQMRLDSSGALLVGFTANGV